jgi:hypothetical protein
LSLAGKRYNIIGKVLQNLDHGTSSSTPSIHN